MSRHLTTVVFAVTILVTGAIADAAPLGTAFTYQGQLKDGGVAATGVYDFEFKLFDAASGGAQVGSTQTKDDVAVASGLFVVSLDFGAPAFVGNARFLEIGVRPGASAGAFTPLPGRQELTPAPNAIYAGNSGQLNGQAASYYTNLANMTGTLGIANGGTGATTADGARSSIGAAPESFAPFSPTTVDGATANVGDFASIAIGADGFPLISYYDLTNGDLKVAHCLDRACKASEITTLDTSGFTGNHSSIAIGSDGLGIISFRGGSQNLRAAHCSNIACSSATISLVEVANNQIQHSSITIGTDGFPLISYFDGVGNDLKVAHCGDVLCTTGLVTLTALDLGDGATSFVGRYSSITIGSDGLGIIAYEDFYNLPGSQQRAKIAHCSNVACTAATVSVLDGSQSGSSNGITIGYDGLAVISYAVTGGARVAHCTNVLCSTSTTTTIVSGGGPFSSSIGPDGFPIVAHSFSSLKVAHCGTATCSPAPTSVTLDAVSVSSASLAIGIDGFAVIAYYDQTNGDLKVAHCTNAACAIGPKKR